jgi:ribosomal protein S18 acetylase RimI-like enzyme
MRGYLVYENNNPIGWCNANDKLNFERLRLKDELWGTNNSRICSVVCFLIHPHQRGNGLASRLLKQACNDYSEKGYDFIEGYPQKDKTSNE